MGRHSASGSAPGGTSHSSSTAADERAAEGTVTVTRPEGLLNVRSAAGASGSTNCRVQMGYFHR